MLIKIDNDQYINSDHLVCIAPDLEPGKFCLHMSNQALIYTTDTVVSYIAQTLDADDAFVNEQPEEMSLQSKLAVFIRNNQTGLSFDAIKHWFPQETEDTLTAALNELSANLVIKELLTANSTTLYYHASNPPEW